MHSIFLYVLLDFFIENISAHVISREQVCLESWVTKLYFSVEIYRFLVLFKNLICCLL